MYIKITGKNPVIFVYAETMRFELMRVLLPCLVSSEVPSTSSATSPYYYTFHRHTISLTLTSTSTRLYSNALRKSTLQSYATSPYYYTFHRHTFVYICISTLVDRLIIFLLENDIFEAKLLEPRLRCYLLKLAHTFLTSSTWYRPRIQRKNLEYPTTIHRF